MSLSKTSVYFTPGREKLACNIRIDSIMIVEADFTEMAIWQALL